MRPDRASHPGQLQLNTAAAAASTQTPAAMGPHSPTSGDSPFGQTRRPSAEKLRGKPSPSYKDMVRRSSSPDKMGRSSFSSVRENDSELAQAFTSSKFSSYDPFAEQAVEDRSTSTTREASPDLISTSPRSPDWSQLNTGTMTASCSLGTFRPAAAGARNDQQRSSASESLSPVETLPPEVFDLIVRHLVLDIPPNGVERRNVDLIALLLTSKTVSSKTIATIYRRVTIPHSRIFQKFLAQITANPQCGKLVRRLDFSHFNPATLFMTAKERAAARNLTSETLLRCLELTPELQEFLVQEYIDDDLSTEVLQKLFLGMDRMQALDFCGCSSTSFRDAFASAPSWKWPETVGIKRLSLHKCLMLPSSVFETILPRLKGLTHLDVAGTKITDKALMSISPYARISHLNLATCRLLTTEGIIKFLTTHPAVRGGLVFLSLATDARTQDSIESADVTRILQVLPKTLQSLSLKGSQMESSHLQLLRPLTRHLEELAIGHGLDLKELDQLFVQDKSSKSAKRSDGSQSTLKFLDMTDMWESELAGLYADSVLLTKATYPLEVIELTPDFMKRMTKSPTRLSKFGWTLSEVHRRSWIVRMADPNGRRDDGGRPWKMGARFWGMRKIPVAIGEVGGMYGSFMFGRNL